MALSNVAKVRDVAAENVNRTVMISHRAASPQHFDEASEEEFGHARGISKYQTLRGGRLEPQPRTHTKGERWLHSS